MSVSPNSPEGKALEGVQAEYNDGLSFINKIEEDEQSILHDESQIAIWGPLTKVLGSTVVDKFKANEAAAEADMATEEDKLKALDPSIQSLCEAIDSLNACIKSETGEVYGDLVASDIHNLQPALVKIFDAMKEKLQGDLYAEAVKNGLSNQLTDSELANLAAASIQYSTAELGDLQDVQTILTNLITVYNNAYNQANVDLNGYNFWDNVGSDLGLDNAAEEEQRDKSVMANAQGMIKGISALLKSLAPEMSALDPQMEQIINVINEVLRRVEKIIKDIKMNPKQKQAALLSLVMFVLTYFQLVKQNIDSQKAENNQQMSKGVVQASLGNIDDATSNQEVEEEIKKNEKLLQFTMEIFTATLGVTMMLMAPGVGTAILVAMVTAFQEMQTAGVLNVTDSIAKAFGCSQLESEIFVAGMECIFTVGGGAALDAAAQAFFKEAVQEAAETAMQTADQAIEQGVQKAIANAGLEGDPTAVKAAEEAKTALQKVAEQAAQKAAQGAINQFRQLPFYTLFKETFSLSLTKSVNSFATTAAEEAIERAIDDAALIGELAAKGIPSTEDMVESVSTRAANESVASVSGKSLKSVSTEAARSIPMTALARFGWTLLFAAANTNMMVDIAKKAGVSSDALDEIFEAIEQLIQMIALMGGSGMLSGATAEGIMAGVPKTVQLLQVVPNSLNSASSYAMYLTKEQEAGAVEALSLNSSVSDLLHSFLEQLQKDGNIARDNMVSEQVQEAQSTASMAGHLHDGDQELARVLLSAV